MLTTQKEIIFSNYFYKKFPQRWLVLKKINRSLAYTLYMDFWTRDKIKVMLLFKTAFFLHLLKGMPFLRYRSKKQTFRHKYKPDTLILKNNLVFLLNARHFLYYSILKRRGDYKNIKNGFLFQDMSDYIKSNTIDFYQAKASFRIMFKQNKRRGSY